MSSTVTDEHALEFIDLGRRWEGGLWRSLFCLLFIIVVFFAVTFGVLYFLAQVFHPAYLYWVAGQVSSTLPWKQGTPSRAMFEYGYLLWSVGFASIAIYLGARLFHNTDLKSLLTAKETFDWYGLGKSAVWFFMLWFISFAAFYTSDPDNFIVIFELKPFLSFLAITVVLLPFQVLGEEVFYRAYLMQLIRRLTSSKMIVLVIPAALFAVTHFANPNDAFSDVWAKTYYVVAGLYYGLLVLRTNGIEHSVGFHLANNIVAFTLVSSNYERPLAPTVLYTWAGDNFIELLMFIAFCTAHYFCLFGLPTLWARWSNKTLPAP